MAHASRPLPEWNARFHVPGANKSSPMAQPDDSNDETAVSAASPSRVSFDLSSQEPGAKLERALSEKCMELAAGGQRGMLREEFCTRFATRDAFAKHHLACKSAHEPHDAPVVSPEEALHISVVDALIECHLTPDFLCREAVLEILASAKPHASAEAGVRGSAKSVSFGGNDAPGEPHSHSPAGGAEALGQREATRRAPHSHASVPGSQRRPGGKAGASWSSPQAAANAASAAGGPVTVALATI